MSVSGAPVVTPSRRRSRVELVEQPEEVVLVGAAAVVEDERALGLARRLAQAVDQLGAHVALRAAVRG